MFPIVILGSMQQAFMLIRQVFILMDILKNITSTLNSIILWTFMIPKHMLTYIIFFFFWGQIVLLRGLEVKEYWRAEMDDEIQRPPQGQILPLPHLYNLMYYFKKL